MLIAFLVSVGVAVGAVVYVIKRKKNEDDYVDGSTLSYDDIYPVGVLVPEKPAAVEPPPVMEPVKAAPKKKVAKKSTPKKKKRGRPAKKKSKM